MQFRMDDFDVRLFEWQTQVHQRRHAQSNGHGITDKKFIDNKTRFFLRRHCRVGRDVDIVRRNRGTDFYIIRRRGLLTLRRRRQFGLQVNDMVLIELITPPRHGHYNLMITAVVKAVSQGKDGLVQTARGDHSVIPRMFDNFVAVFGNARFCQQQR
ncbi:hypothetical protein D3C80_1031170 [compost metagenome]